MKVNGRIEAGQQEMKALVKEVAKDSKAGQEDLKAEVKAGQEALKADQENWPEADRDKGRPGEQGQGGQDRIIKAMEKSLQSLKTYAYGLPRAFIAGRTTRDAPGFPQSSHYRPSKKRGRREKGTASSPPLSFLLLSSLPPSLPPSLSSSSNPSSASTTTSPPSFLILLILPPGLLLRQLKQQPAWSQRLVAI